MGLSTLGFDPTRFQTGPPACYRASWQLPGPDFHRQVTTSTPSAANYIMLTTSGSWAHENEFLKKAAAYFAQIPR